MKGGWNIRKKIHAADFTTFHGSKSNIFFLSVSHGRMERPTVSPIMVLPVFQIYWKLQSPVLPDTTMPYWFWILDAENAWGNGFEKDKNASQTTRTYMTCYSELWRFLIETLNFHPVLQIVLHKQDQNNYSFA